MTFEIQCPKCGAGYRIKNELAGKKGSCKRCDEVFQLQPPEEEKTQGGSKVLRHVAKQDELEFAPGDADLIEAISDHAERHIGEVSMVFHELISDKVHVDVHHIEPTSERPWHVLFTSGMSERPMTTPEELDDADYAELVLCLPEAWPLTEQAFKDENNYWPVRWLKILARMPHDYETWLGWGHTIPNGDPMEPFGNNTKCCCWMLLDPPWFGDDFMQLRVDDGRLINFFTPIPLYANEVQYKLDKGAEGLLERFETSKIPFDKIFDPRRPSSLRKRFGFW